MEEPGASAASRRLAWTALCVAALAPLLGSTYPPLYDYYHWVFEGHLVSSLLFGGGPHDEAIAESYGLARSPVPNMAASVMLGLLETRLPPLIAGRVFVAVCVLLFASSFGFLIRRLRGHPAAVELLGFPWAFGFFLYKGYLSYMFSLGLSFLAVAWLHKTTEGGAWPPSRKGALALAVLGIVLYLSHVIGWAVFLSAVALYGVALWRRGGSSSATRLAALLLPSCILPAWYALVASRPEGATFYQLWSSKARSLLEPGFLFVRTDPIPPPFSTGWATLLGVLALAVVVLGTLDRRRRPSRLAVGLAAVLGGAAVALPFLNFQGMNRPDGRLFFPALLMAIAAVPSKRLTTGWLAFTGGLVLGILTLHTVEYRRASAYLETMEGALERSVPEEGPGLSLTIRPGPKSGCGEAGIGRTDTLRWFGLVHLLKSGGVRVSLMATSVVEKYFDHDDPHDLQSIVLDSSEIPDLSPSAQGYAGRYAYLEIFGCPNDVREAARELSLEFEDVASGPGFAVMSRPRGRFPNRGFGDSDGLVSRAAPSFHLPNLSPEPGFGNRIPRRPEVSR